MKTLVIPDIHLDIDWAGRMLEQHQPDSLIMLGDYFDPSPRARMAGKYSAAAGESAAVVRWLHAVLEEYGDNAVLLIGNHDTQYLFLEHLDLFRIGGYSRSIQEEIEALPAEIAAIRNAVRWFHHDPESGILFSHAGVHPEVFGDADGSVTVGLVEEVVREAENNLKDGILHPAFDVGYARGGDNPAGGLTWLDFNREFQPVPGLKQVVGHTPQQNGYREWDGNIALDGIQSTVAVIQDGVLEILHQTGVAA